LADFYRGLTSLKHAHPALWNGVAGGPVEILPETTRTLLAFSRSREDDRRYGVDQFFPAQPQGRRFGTLAGFDPEAIRIYDP